MLCSSVVGVVLDCFTSGMTYRAGFPGSQPVSMDVQNIGLLNQRPYKVSWKADGTRQGKLSFHSIS